MTEAFKGGETVLDEATLNNLLLSSPDFALIYEGAVKNSFTGSGVFEFDLVSYSYAIKIVTTGTSEISRIVLELVKHGEGTDVHLQFRGTNYLPDGSNDGALLKTVVIPKEHIPVAKSWWSIPVDLTGLTAGAGYWVIIPKTGDGENHVHLHGENSQNGAYPVYRRVGLSGAWELANSAHFYIYSGESGELLHAMYGPAYETLEFDANQIPIKCYRYIPPASGPEGGIRGIYPITWSGEYLKRGGGV